jgi:hypothetical protein
MTLPQIFEPSLTMTLPGEGTVWAWRWCMALWTT